MQSTRKLVEYILWGTKKGDDDWQEQLITTATATPEGKAKLEKAKAWANEQGFDRLRVSELSLETVPDFTKLVRR